MSKEFLTPADQSLRIGAIVFPDMDQIDLTGPFSVLARLPNSSIQLLWKTPTVVQDQLGLKLVPDASFSEAAPMDVLLVPGGPGQEQLMEDETVLNFITKQARQAKITFSVCTGSLICGAAGLLKGRSATTHWASLHLLKYFGARTSHERVVIDGNLVSAAGLTSGIDGALRVAALLRGEEVAKGIELAIQYAPDPPFGVGSPELADDELLSRVTAETSQLTEKRLQTAKRLAAKFKISTTE
ncbi:DJ-1/PfpI family protein [Bremerella alba]|uniref:Isonitrile hydratase n=1 Tax=Bremerella alba TaxID=980252 RepID=A0A7V8V6S3_9BACT|nr:DJ-1/PfpI family protein [Bremerella alba]MBA2115998.1 Isonitrile hydratase [Bremerella alba]